jgi:hypothetical protein
MTTTPETPTTIGAELERSRLERRERRIERALDVLRAHRTRRSDAPQGPAQIDQAIAGFGEELSAVRDRLHNLH